jgi:hypothetical protein
MAFLLGLLHGFGFSSTLMDLGVSQTHLAISLLGFNLGVEIGQLAIVTGFLPVAFALRKTTFYRRIVLPVGSALIVLIASIWTVERAFLIRLLG